MRLPISGKALAITVAPLCGALLVVLMPLGVLGEIFWILVDFGAESSGRDRERRRKTRPGHLTAFFKKHIYIFEAELSLSRKVYLVGTFLLMLSATIWMMSTADDNLFYLLIEATVGIVASAIVMHFQELRWFRQDQRRKIRFIQWRPKTS